MSGGIKMTNNTAKPRELYLYIDEIDEGRRKLDLGESMVINMTMYPRKDEMPFLTKVVEISALHAANERVKELESANRELVEALEKFVKKHYQYILDHVKMHSYSGHLSDAMDTVVRHESWSAAQRHFEMCFPQLTQQHTTKSNELQSSGKG
jgi:hypothetical protein